MSYSGEAGEVCRLSKARVTIPTSRALPSARVAYTFFEPRGVKFDCDACVVRAGTKFSIHARGREVFT